MIFENKKDIRVFIVLALLAMTSIGIIGNCAGVFYNAVAESLNVKRGSIAFYMTIMSLIGAIPALYIPKIMNQKNYKRIIILSNAIVAICYVLFGVVKKLYQIYIIAAIGGTFEAFFANSALNFLILSNFKTNTGKISSSVYLFSGIAGIVFSPFLTTIIERFNYSIAYDVVAAFIFVLCIPLWFVDLKVDFQDKKVEQKEVSNNKQGIKFFLFLIMSCIFYAVSVFPQYFIGYGTLKGLTSIQASYLISASMVGNVAFKPINGILCDKIGGVRTSAIITATNLIGLLIMFFSNNYFVMLLAAFIYGANYTLSSFMHSLLCKDLFEDNFYSVYPKAALAVSISYSFTSSLYGYCYDFTGNYNIVIYAIIAFDIFDLICFAYLDKGKRTLKEKL